MESSERFLDGTWKAAFVEAFLAGDFIFSAMSLFIFPPDGVIFTLADGQMFNTS